MPLQATSGAASYDAFGGGVAVVPTYIEDVFSTYLYTGNGSTQTITNGIDLSTKGGLVWIKGRNGTGEGHTLFDTARGVNQVMQTQNTDGSANFNNSLTAFNTTGFSLGTNRTDPSVNYVSWTFRKQPKFFDIVTYTGTGSTRSVSHNLGCVPGFIIVKNTSNAANWAASLAPDADWNNRKILLLNTTDADGATATYTNGFINTATSTTVSLTQNSGTNVNTSGNTYVMYLFAHNAGGFGLTGTDNVISCGSYTGNGSTTGPTVTLGYEPQWLLIKNTTSGAATSNWQLYDSMRGLNLSRSDYLLANKTDAENGVIPPDITPTATGFFPSSSNLWVNTNGSTYIYIAIRRGPMKVPTTGTSVFAPAFVQAAANNATRVQTGFPVDMTFMNIAGSTAAVEMYEYDRLRNKAFQTYSTAVEQSNPFGSGVSFASNTGFVNVSGSSLPTPSFNTIFLNFQRAPSFFDVVCYTGNNVSGRTITHNLAAVPQLMLVKSRTSGTRDWIVYDATNGATKYMNLNNNSASGSGSFWVSTAPTSTVFTVSDSASVNDPAQNYAAYLFATCAGVSKVSSYNGSGALQTVDCGFTGGARFVLIKRTDSTGDWYVWDSARGISSGDDPYLLLNSTAAQVNNTNYVDTDTTGFKVTAAAPAGLNASGGTYIFLAIA